MSRTRTQPAPLNLQWGWVFGSAIAGLALLMALHYVYITFYSHVLHPERDMAFFMDHVRYSGPYFVMIAGAPVMFLLCLLAGRFIRTDIVANCLLMAVVMTAISTIMLVMSDDLRLVTVPAHAALFLGAYLGGALAKKSA